MSPQPRAKCPHYLRQWREHKGLYQEELAKRVHVAKSVVSRFETDGRDIKLRMLFKFAKALGIQPWQLLYPVGTTPAQAVMAGMSDEERARFINSVKDLAKNGE